MFVKEFGRVKAQDLNEQLNKVYKWQLDLTKITESDAASMISTLQTKINRLRTSSNPHKIEQNPEFMEAVTVTRVLEAWLSELSVGRRPLSERELTPGEMKKREHYVKSMKKVKPDFEKRYGSDRGENVMYATATKMAKESTTESAMNILKFALLEGDIDQAKVTMAARDMADSVQDIVSKISEMQNEKLPALITAMKDEVGVDQATQFNSSAGQALAALLDAANQARDALDNASRGVYNNDMAGGIGGGMGAPTGGIGSGDLGGIPPVDGGEDLGDESDLDVADTATGGDAEMGRGKRI
jgi:hypothetical protein